MNTGEAGKWWEYEREGETAPPRHKTAQTGGAEAAGRQQFTTIRSRLWAAASSQLCLEASELFGFEQISNLSELFICQL